MLFFFKGGLDVANDFNQGTYLSAAKMGLALFDLFNQ